MFFLFGRMIRGRSDNAALGAIEQCIIRGKNRTMQLGTPGRIGVIKPFGFAKISFWIELNKAENEQTERGEMPIRSKQRHILLGRCSGPLDMVTTNRRGKRKKTEEDEKKNASN